MADFKIFRKITPNVSIEHWTLNDPDYDKYVREDDSFFADEHDLTEDQILALGATEISEPEWETYTDEAIAFIPGSRPPHKPKP